MVFEISQINTFSSHTHMSKKSLMIITMKTDLEETIFISILLF